MFALRQMSYGLSRSRLFRATSSLNAVSRSAIEFNTDDAAGAATRERPFAATNAFDADVAATSSTPEPKLSPAEFRKFHQISVRGEGAADFDPWMNFDETPFMPSLRRVLTTAGYTSPTSIQAQSWPIASKKRDIISVARTGSGKTCGFLLPALHRIMEEREADKFEAQKRYTKGGGRKIPSVLVLAPTRELAVQIEVEAQKFARAANAFTMSVYGGTPKGPQIQKLRAGVDIIVATPGRCNDLLEMGVLNLSAVKYLVLDEADRMLDMGFEPQIRTIIDELPEDRQSLFFTATWPKEVQGLARDFLTNPVHISVGDSDSLNANKAIKQYVTVCQQRDKDAELDRVLQQINPSEDPNNVPKTIIFMNRKHACDDLSENLRRRGYAVDTLHGDMSQALRTIAMQRFRSGRLKMLVCTDVAARGLDVKDIATVINYDFPTGSNGVEDYVHRIGRTARGMATGEAFTFFTRSDEDRARELGGVLTRCEQEVPVQLEAMMRGKGRSGPPGKGRSGPSSGRKYGGGGGGGRYGSMSAPREGGAREWAPKKDYAPREGGYTPRYGSPANDGARPTREWGSGSDSFSTRERSVGGAGERRPASRFNFGERRPSQSDGDF